MPEVQPSRARPRPTSKASGRGASRPPSRSSKSSPSSKARAKPAQKPADAPQNDQARPPDKENQAHASSVVAPLLGGPLVAPTAPASGAAASWGAGLKDASEKIVGWAESTYDSLNRFVGATSNKGDANAELDKPNDTRTDDTKSQYGEFNPALTKDFFEERQKRTKQESKTKEIHRRGRKSGAAAVHDALQSASNLSQGFSVLSSMKRLIFLNDETGTSVAMAGAATAAAQIGAEKKEQAPVETEIDGEKRGLQALVDTLGPIVLGYDDRLYESDEARPSFIFDLRRLYNPNAALSDAMLAKVIAADQGRSMSPKGLPQSFVDYFGNNPDVLDAILGGFADSSWLDNKSRYVDEKRDYKFHSDIKGKLDIVPKIRRALYAEGERSREKLESFLQREVLLLSNDEVGQLTNQTTGPLGKKVRKMILDIREAIKDGFPQDPGDNPVPPTVQAPAGVTTSPGQKTKKSETTQDVEKVLESLTGPNRRYLTMEEAKQALADGLQWLDLGTDSKSKVDLSVLKNATEISILSPLMGKDGTPKRFTFVHAHNAPKEATMIDGLLYAIRLKHGNTWGVDSQNMFELYKYLRGMGPLMNIVDSNGDKHLILIQDAFHLLFERWDDNRRLHADFDMSPKTDPVGANALYTLRKRELLKAIREGRSALREEAPRKRPRR